MNLPKRRKKQKMGVREVVQKIWPRHRRWVKSHGCCVPNCELQILVGVALDFAHLRSAANAGKDQKPHDMFGISLCRIHHDEQHKIGQPAFDRKYGIDSWGLAAMFTSKSTDTNMRDALRLVSAEELV